MIDDNSLKVNRKTMLIILQRGLREVFNYSSSPDVRGIVTKRDGTFEILLSGPHITTPQVQPIKKAKES